MKTASISALKARLSEFLDAVRDGQDVLVTDRGRPIARITAVRDRQQRDARRDLLIRTGRLRPPQRRMPRDFYSRELPADPKGRTLAALLEERREGR
ncbi:MAG: type II toxin-antitoxin system Phd/YefM family antitoxin [Gemmatimonadaceae bacterium]